MLSKLTTGSPLLNAVEANDIRKVTEIINNLDAKIRKNLIVGALFCAVNNGLLKMTEFLLDNGANINFVDNFGNTPLSRAITANHVKIINLLIARKASFTASALMSAAEMNNIPVATTALKTVDVNAKGKFGEDTALSRAVECGHLEMTTFLLDNGANVNSTTPTGVTMLAIAARRGDVAITELLIARRADFTGSTPEADSLRQLLEYGSIDMAAVLVACGAKLTLYAIDYLILHPKALPAMTEAGLDLDAKLNVSAEGAPPICLSPLQIFAKKALEYARTHPRQAFPLGIQALAKAGAIVDFEEPEKIHPRIAALLLGKPGDKIPGTDKITAGKVFGAYERRAAALALWAARHPKPDDSSAVLSN